MAHSSIVLVVLLALIAGSAVAQASGPALITCHRRLQLLPPKSEAPTPIKSPAQSPSPITTATPSITAPSISPPTSVPPSNAPLSPSGGVRPPTGTHIVSPKNDVALTRVAFGGYLAGFMASVALFM